MSLDYIDGTERIGGLIVQVFADTTGVGDPRENDNLTEMVFVHRSYQLGDRQQLTSGEEQALEHGGFPALVKHLKRQPEGLLAISKVGMYDHSGITIYPIAPDGNGHYAFDQAGWDSGILGFAFITKARWDELHGGDPEEMVDSEVRLGMGRLDVKRRAADEVIRQELDEYDSWVRGEVWAYRTVEPCKDHPDEHATDERIADCAHSVVIDSCYGFVGDSKYAWEEARAAAQSPV